MIGFRFLDRWTAFWAAVATVSCLSLMVPARAAAIDGVNVVMHGVPACFKPNPMPNLSNGTFRPRLPDLGTGDNHGATDPWGQYPYARFRGATYGALFGATDAPSRAVYYFDPNHPQTSISFLWGTPDWFNLLVLSRNGNIVATVNGADVAAVFGFKTALNLTISGVEFDKAVFQSEGTAYEFANLNAACPSS